MVVEADNAARPSTGASAMQVADDSWTWRRFPVTADRHAEGSQVVMCQSAIAQIHRHGRSARHVEVCGVMVGDVYRDELGDYVHVQHTIRGCSTTSTAGSVTFTSDTWTHFHETMERDYPGSRILGWYHTHPGFGAFLSAMDVFIQRNFFNLPWQVAFVHDPIQAEDKLFTWQSGEISNAAYVIEPDESAVGMRRVLGRQQANLIWAMMVLVAVAMISVAVSLSHADVRQTAQQSPPIQPVAPAGIHGQQLPNAGGSNCPI